MYLQAIITATAIFLASATATKLDAAIVTIEASHGGAGQDLTNQTVTIPLTNTYVNHSALDAVSSLYLVGARGVPLDSVSCTPFKNANGTGKGGLTFDSTTPSLLSTNTVQVGSIVCISTNIQMAPGPGLGSSSSSAGLVTTTKHTKTATRLAHTGHSTTTSTSTQTTATAAQTSASSSSSQAPQSTGNAASNLGLPSEVFGGLALAGFGLAFAL